MKLKLAIALAISCLAFAADAQVRQSGNVTQKHMACWTTTGVIQDCGTAAIPFASSLGTVGQGPTICANSAASTVPYNQLCLSANTSSNAQIVLQNYGGAVPQGLDLNINGTILTFPSSLGGTIVTAILPVTSTHLPCFSGTTGTIADCGLAATSGVITSGTWQGTPVGVSYGGTGANSASGARTNLGLGTMATQDASAVAITGGSITGLPSPSVASQAVPKSYVDAFASGIIVLAASDLATAAVLPNSPTYSNGTLGVGATLTAGSNTTLTVDATAAPLNTVVLVKTQAAPAQNGIYKVTTAGDGSNAWVLTRVTYFDQAAEMTAGSYTFVSGGATNANSSWTLATTVATVGTNAVNWNNFSSVNNVVSSLGGVTGPITLAATLAMTGSQLGVVYAPIATDVTRYGASGSAQTTTGTITGSTSALTLAGAIDFANGQGIICVHCGDAPTIGVPTLVSVAAATLTPTGSTTYDYKIAAVDYNGGITAATAAKGITNGYVTLGFRQSDGLQPAGVDVRWTLGTGTPLCTAVWRSKSGGAYTLLGCFSGTYIDDQGVPTVSVPWIPDTPPGSALADWLATTISAGGGTTSLTLAHAAGAGGGSGATVMHDDTTAFNSAIAANSSVSLPCGTYNLRQPLLNGTLSLIGAGMGCSIIKVLSPETSFGLNGGLVVVGATPFTMSGLSVYAVPSMAFHGAAFYLTTKATICNNEFKGINALYFVQTDKTTACNNYFTEWWNAGFLALSSFGTIVNANHVLPITGEVVQNNKTGSSYGFATGIVATGVNGETLITNNDVNQQGGLIGINCVGIQGSQCQATNNNVQYTGRECISLASLSFSITGNNCYWLAANNGKFSSYDYGTSVADDGTNNVLGGIISGNIYTNTMFSGIAISGTGGSALLRGVSIQNNTLYGANQVTSPASVHTCGIEITGSNSQNIAVGTNIQLGPTGFTTYNVCEANIGGTGAPNNNIVGIQTGIAGASGTVSLVGSNSYWQTAPANVVGPGHY